MSERLRRWCYRCETWHPTTRGGDALIVFDRACVAHRAEPGDGEAVVTRPKAIDQMLSTEKGATS